jgi:hypothetical protein
MSHTCLAKAVVLGLLLGCLNCGRALADECNVPKAIKTYLNAHADWALVRRKDLVEDDQNLWDKYHRGHCPGFAVVDLDGRGKKSFALALLRRAKENLVEKLILLEGSENGLMEQTLVEEQPVDNPFVVWKGKAAKTYDYATDRYVLIKNDPIVYEKMESTSKVYYRINGKFRSLLASD